MIITQQPSDWKDLQNKVGEILKQCGFYVEIEKTIQTARGQAEIDVYAEENIKGRRNLIICECKYWKANIPQNVIHGFRTVVNDLGCNIGYIITTSDYQSGSVNTAQYTNIELLTWEDFQLIFFESWYEAFFSPEMAKQLDPLLSYTEPFLPRWFENLTEEDKNSYIALRDKYDLFGRIVMSFTPIPRVFGKTSIPTLPLIERIGNDKEITDRIPLEILNEVGYKEFQERCFEFGEKAISEFRYYRDKYYDGASN